MKVYEAVAEGIWAEGVRKAFVVLGHGNMQSCIRLGELGAALRSARHEAAAVAMAEGYALATGTTGFASVTRGPGLTQLGTALMMASRNHVPLVILTGDTSEEAPSHVQAMDQRRFAESCETIYRTVRSAGTVHEDVREAFYRAAVEQRPVILSIGAGLKDQPYDWGGDYRPATAAQPLNRGILPDEATLNEFLERLTDAERPLLLVGRGGLGAGPALEEIAERLGAVILTTLPAKGFMSHNPYCLGMAGVFVTEAGEAASGDADFVLALGASLNRYTLEGGLQFPNADVWSVNIRPWASYGDTFADTYVWGEVAATVGWLADRLATSNHRATGFRTPEYDDYLVRQRRQSADVSQRTRPRDDLLDPREVTASVDQHLPANAWIVIGQGHYWAFPIAEMRGPGGARFVVAGESGAVGNALGTAIGFAEGVSTDPVILFEGDGSLMMHLQELDTISRYRTRLLVVVMNDEAFGSEFHSLRAHGIDPMESIIPSPALDDVATAMGWMSFRATTREECDRAVESFFSDTRPHLIDARISREIVSAPARRLEYGDPAFCPLL